MLPRRALAALLAMPAAARAQAWPDRPIRLLVPFAPGGNTDGLARLAAEALQEALPGSAIVVENRSGASGLLALEALLRGPADGHVLMMASMSTLAVAPAAAQPRPRFDAGTDIAPIVNMGTSPFVLVAHRAVPASDAAALIAWMRANSGRFAYASGGVGSTGHLTAELFLRAIGATADHVAYRGGAPALADVIAGVVPVIFASLAEAIRFQGDAQLRLIGISAPARDPQLPALPPLAESVTGFESVTWNGLIGPAGLPAPLAARLHGILAAAMARPGFAQRLRLLGAEPSGEGPEAFARRIAADAARWGALVREAGITGG
jgi:tripartite-type tricarboxylate transporter receptor subunit TctC